MAGAWVVVADVDERGAGIAAAIGGRFARCDVREQAGWLDSCLPPPTVIRRAPCPR